MITVRPLETSVRDLAPDTLVYVIREGWALAYRAEMLDDRANELYGADCTAPDAEDGATVFTASHVWWSQLSRDYVAATPELESATYHACAWLSVPEAEFRRRYGLPVDKVHHPR